MKSKSLEMILDNMYFIASVDEKEEKVFVALDFEEAGRKYAELKSEGDAIIWHLRKKDLVSRVDCDLRTPIEMVSEERLLRLMSLVVVEGKDNSSVSLTVETDERPETTVVDEDEIRDDENSHESKIMDAVENYNMDIDEVRKDINKITSHRWYRNFQDNLIVKSIILANRENIRIRTAYLLLKLRIQYRVLMRYMLYEFRRIMAKDDMKYIKSEATREMAATQIIEGNIRRRIKQKKKSSERELPESIKIEKDSNRIETLSSAELDQKTITGDLVDGWKRWNDPVSTPKVKSSDEVKKPKPVPSSRVLLRGFLSYCKKRGLSKKRMQRRVLHVKTFLKFIKKNGISILEIDEERVKEFESFLRDVRGFKRGTAGEYSGTVRIFYDYTNSEGITNIDLRRSIRARPVTRMMEIVGKPLTGVYDDESNTIYEEVNQKILEGIEKLGNKVKRMDLTRFVLNIPKSDKLSSGSKAFIGAHLHYLVEHDILRRSSVDRYDVFSKCISEPTSHKVGETMGIVSSEKLIDGFGRWLKEKGFTKTNRNEYTHVSIAREFIGHINDIGKTILDDDREHMIDLHKSHLCKRGLKESTIRTYIRGICVFYNYMDENPSEELLDQNKNIEIEIQLFDDFIRWLEKNHYKKISRIVGIVRNFKDCIVSGEKTILDDDRGRMIDLYRSLLQTLEYKKSTVKTYVSMIHLFYRFVDEMDEHHEKAGEASILSDDPEKRNVGLSPTKHLIDGFKSWLERKGFVSINKSGYGHGYIGCVREYMAEGNLDAVVSGNFDCAFSPVDIEKDIEEYKSRLRDRGLMYGSISYRVSAINAFYRFIEEDLIDADLKPDVLKGKRKEVDESKSIPSIEVLLEEFDERCKMRGMTKKTVRRYVSYAKDFIEFVEETGEFILDVDERTLEAFKSHLRDGRGFKKGTISVYFAAIRAFYDYTNFKGITDVSEPISHGAEGVKLIPSIPGLLKGFADNCELKGTNKKDVYRRKMQSRAFINFVKGNGRSILEVDEQTLEEYESYLKDDRGFKEATIKSHCCGIRAFYDYTNSEGFTDVDMRTKRNRSTSRKVSEVTDEVSQHPKSIGERVKRADGEKSTDQYPRTHLGWAERAVGKDGDLSRMHIDMSNEVFEPNFRYIYEGVVQRIIESIKGSRGRQGKGDVVREVLNIPEGDEIPSGASFFIQVHLKYMVEHNLVERIEDGIYIAVPVDQILGIRENLPKVRKIPSSVFDEGGQLPAKRDRICKYCGHLLDKKPDRIGTVDTLQFLKTKCLHCFNPYRRKIHKSLLGKNYRLYTCKKCGHDNLYIYMNRNVVDRKSQYDWISEVLGDDLQKVDMEQLNGGNDKKKHRSSLYTGINQKIFLELKENVSMPRLELIKSLFDFEGSIPKSIGNIMSAHLRYLVDQGFISRIQKGVYTLADDDKKVVNEKVSASTIKDEKTPHRGLSAEDWIRRITKGEKPYAWISYGSMDDTRVVQRGQGTPIYSGINRRIMVEVRASKDPIKRSELIRPVFDLGWGERISQTVNTILNNHLRYLLYKNVVKQPARGYYESVPDDVTDYRIDPVSERKIHEGVMDRVAKKWED